MNRSLEQALKSLSSSGLMSEQEIREFLDALPFDSRPNDSDSLWSRLVEGRLLTRFQVDVLANGAPHPLRLGDHVLLEPLGAGGMGVVFKAWNQRLERTVAVKILSADATRSQTAVARFHKEAKAAARLHHHNVVTIFDAGEEQDTHYLAMEFVDGVDLLRYVRNQGVLSLPIAVGLVVQAARGLKYAHSKGVVHRDVKPSNLLLDKEGNIKILDLGLARIGDPAALHGDPEDDDLTAAGEAMGTFGYIAPEQAEDARRADARSDIYALGCTLYFLLTGRTIASGSSRGSSHALQVHPAAESLSLRDHRPDASAEFEAVFKRMVASLPEARYGTMAEVIVALEPFRGGAGVGADESRVVLDIPTTDATPSPDATDPRGRRRASTVRPDGSQPTPRKTAAAASPNRRWSQWGVPGSIAVLVLVAVGLASGPVASGLRAGLTGGHEDGHLSTESVANPPQELIHIPPLRIVELTTDGMPVVISRKFDRDKALELQTGISEFLNADREFANSIGMSLAIVPPHRLQDEETGEMEITPPIYMGTMEVTQLQYQRVMGVNPSVWVRGGKFEKRLTNVEDTTQFPVEKITLAQAEEFCKRLSELPGESAAGRVYRIPTRNEWHAACRAGEGDIHPNKVSKYAWCDLNSGIPGVIDSRRPHTVGTLAPNPFGMYDMLGNVGEMSSDRLAGKFLAVGSNFDQMAMYQIADRDHWTSPETALDNRGFRVVCTTPEMRRYAIPEQAEP